MCTQTNFAIKLKYTDTPIEPPTSFTDTSTKDELNDFSDTAPTDNLKSFSNTAPTEHPAVNNAEPLQDTLQATQTDTHHNITNTDNGRPDGNCSCRGGLLFSFTKRHEVTKTRTYKSGRTRDFIYTTTFAIMIYI